MINGDRVKQARELRSLTQVELARLVEIHQSSIAYIESGRFAPSQELLAAIAKVTKFPPAFFEQEATDDFPLGSLVLFRARASVTAREEVQVHQYGKAVYECTTKLARRVTAIPLRLPQLVDETPENAAIITRSVLGLSPDTPINDLIYTIERAGVFVLALPLTLERIDAFSLWAGPDSEQPVVIILEGAPGDRLRFSVAHEVGHLVMHRSIRGAIQGVEKEADRFAGAFLLPESAIRQELVPPLTLTTLAALKRRWRVAMQALIMRAFELSIITERQKRYLFQQFSARGWRTREPPALDVLIERPRALRQMVELLYGIPIDYRRLANDVNLPEELLEVTLEAHAAKPQGSSNIIPFPTSISRNSSFRY